MIARFKGREECAGRTLPWRRSAAAVVCLAVGALCAAGSTSVLSTNVPVAPPLPSSASAVFSLVRVLGALAIVLAVFFGGVWLFRNWQRTLVGKGSAPRLNILETKSLGQRHALYVVGYDQQRLLIAASPAGVTMLTALPEAGPGVAEIKAAVKPSFTEALRLALQGKR
jgi:flagellar biogenesis protein FliO